MKKIFIFTLFSITIFFYIPIISFGANPNIVDPINGKCDSGFTIFKFSSAVNDRTTGTVQPFQKCIKTGSAEYNNVIKNAKQTQSGYEASAQSYDNAAETTLLPTKVAPRKTAGYNMYVKLPCQSGANCPSTGTPAGYIARLYQFGLMIAGLAAFGSIIYGSLLYVLSAGNIGSQQDARDQITQAILGLALLFGAYLILYTINPNLVSLANPAVEPLNLSGIETPGNEIGTGTQNQNLDPLCKIGAKEGITITEGGSISISGPGGTQNLLEGGRFVCETCKANARKNGNGRCECDTGYVQVQVGSCERPEGVTAPGLLPETDDLQFK
mgnify:CR=1 FL=1